MRGLVDFTVFGNASDGQDTIFWMTGYKYFDPHKKVKYVLFQFQWQILSETTLLIPVL